MSLLFYESPIITLGIFTGIVAGLELKSNLVVGVSVFLLIFMLYFYRYNYVDLGIINDNILISPCEGTVIEILDRYDHYYIPIFLSPMNKHTQIYPANCRVLQRTYDRTGEFAMVMNLSKSQNNEKKIHTLQLANGTVMSLTQIAGFLPRMITSDEDLMTYKAGDYLGMIKFGSRVDLLIPKIGCDGSYLYLNIKKGDSLNLGDLIGQYEF